MEPKYPEGCHCQSVLRHQGFFKCPPLFLIIQWRRQRYLAWSATHDIMSRKIYIWKSLDLLLGSNLWPLAQSAGCLTARPPEFTIYVHVVASVIFVWILINNRTLRGFFVNKIEFAKIPPVSRRHRLLPMLTFSSVDDFYTHFDDSRR